MLRNLKLVQKFTLLLSLVFIGAIAISGVALSHAMQYKANNEVASRGLILMETMNSVRSYTNIQVNSTLSNKINFDKEFIQITVPAYSAREIFEKLRQNPDYQDYLYKEAVLNPTNPRDKADEFEADLVKRFRQEPNLKELSGFRNQSEEKKFYISRPIIIKEEQCLRCHSTPEAAPKSMIATYGSKNGFGWPLKQIIGVQTIYVPSAQVFALGRHYLYLAMSIFVGTFALVIWLINLLLRQTVIQPIKPMSRLAQKISSDQISSEQTEEPDLKNLAKVARGSDELGQLARVLQQMTSAVVTREYGLKQQLQQLLKETDKAKKTALLTQMNDKDYLQQLLYKARKTRHHKVDYQKVNVADLLRKVSYFQSFTDSEIQKLISIGYKKIMLPGEYVCREGEPGDAFYIILGGSVEIYVEKINKFLRNMGAGEFFGELSLLVGIPRTATVRTREDTVLFVLDQNGLQKLLREYQDLAEQIAHKLHEHKEELEQRKEMLREMGLLEDEESFNQNPLQWIRKRMTTLFSL